MSSSSGELLIADWVVVNAHEVPLHEAGVRVVDSRVTEVGPAASLLADFPDDTVHRFGNAVIAPGFVNSHSHTYGVLSHGMTLPSSSGGFGDYLASVWWPYIEDRLTPDMVSTMNELGCAESLLGGVTTLYDIIEAPFATGELLPLVAERATGTGIRVALSFEATERVSARNGLAGIEENTSFIEQLANNPHDRATGIMCWHTSYSCSGRFIQEAVDVARSLGVPAQFHCNEGDYEPDRSLNDFGTSTLEYYQRLGITDADLIASQSVIMTDAEIDIMADTGVAVVHVPVSNGVFGAGIAPIPKMLEREITVGLGTDGFSRDFFEVIRAASVIHRARHQSSTIMPAATVFDMATRGGARALGLDDVGTLETGALADLQVIDIEMPTPVTADNLIEQLVFWRSAHDVTDVMVHGKWCVRDRQLSNVDLDRLRWEANRTAAEFWSASEDHV